MRGVVTGSGFTTSIADISGGLFLSYFFREIQQMALPTPGYNPEVSLLQGGTAPIVPVQGGGGSGISTLPSDYNPSASLLQGGTGVIEPVKGGGAAKKEFRFAPVLEEERVFSKEAAAKNVSRASRAYTLEVYGLSVNPIPLQLESDLSIRQRRLMSYVATEKRTTLLTSLAGVSQSEGGFAYTEYPKYGDCKPSLPINYFTAMPRKVHFLDDRPHTVWVIPNIRGNKELFETILAKLIDKDSLPGKDHILVFTGSFYPDTPNDTTVLFFDEIMKLKQKNPGQVYVLSPKTATLLKNGCFILEHTYAMKTTLAKQQGKSKEVPTFFEPDVLVFPYEQILLRSSDMPISADSKVSVGLLLKKKIAMKSFYIKPEAGRKSDPAHDSLENYVTILSDPNKSETRTWPPKSQQTIKCPKEMDCANFEVGFPLSLLGTSILFNFLESNLYLFHITGEKIPYLTGPKEEQQQQQQQQEQEQEEEEQEEQEEEPVVLEEILEPVAVKVIAPKVIRGFYKESVSAKPSTKTVTFDVGEYRFTVRVPNSHLSSDPIQVDWLNEIFTRDEAKLLNALQLTPSLMKKAFGESYKWRLSNFLSSLTYSSCFKESSLLLRSECDDARRFLRKVGFLLKKNSLETFYKDLATPPPSILNVDLEPIVTELKNLSLEEQGQQEEQQEEQKEEQQEEQINIDSLLQNLKSLRLDLQESLEK